MRSDYFPVHAHSQFSVLDGIGTVDQMVQRVAKLGQPAMALTDHGTMAGAIRLYKACSKAGITPFPGMEAYLVTDATDDDAKKVRYHLGMLALTQKGYKAMLALSSRSFHRDRFHRKPLIDLSDLADLSKHAADDIAITTGCYFGWVVQHHLANGRDVKRTARIVNQLAGWFPKTYVEVQNHGVYHEDLRLTDGDIAADLFEVAFICGLPVVLGQDSHYCEASHQDAHDLMKTICYFGDGEDSTFPGGPYHLAGTKWLKGGWSDERWGLIEEGHADLLDANRLTLPALDTYKFHVPKVDDHPDFTLKQKVQNGLRDLGKWSLKHEAYARRVDEELRVIKKMGMANYFLMVHDIVQHCHSHGWFIDTRGSANGSLVCYALGITTVDPIIWTTDFDRFLSLDRKKPPDIDLDVEHEHRADLIDYVRSKFPTMVQIGTYSKIGITETEDGEEKGSIYVQYAAAMRAKQGHYSGVADEHRVALNQLDRLPAKKSLSAHAGGFVLPGEGLEIGDYLSTALIVSSNTVVTQQTMDDVEDAGYVKLDILGLRMLSTMRRCMELIGKDPIKDGMDWIPPDDPKALRMLRSGQVGNGIFQFEGYSTATGAKEMKVSNTLEAICCLTLYRPAVMAGGQKDRYLAARASGQPEWQPPAIAPIVADTWGVPIFQDQVMSIMRAVGLPYDDLNDVLKAVKASNDKIAEYAEATFERVHPIFVRQAVTTCGMTNHEAEDAWSEVLGFADYGFNRAHATNYGLRGYRMAYLKAHYPTEFMAATLSTWVSTDKEPKYLREAKRMKMVIARPDVNSSDVRWTMDGPMKLRRGLMSIKGIGEQVAEAIVVERDLNGPYSDVADFCHRLPARPVSGVNDLPKGVLKGVCKTLVEANAMKSLGMEAP